LLLNSIKCPVQTWNNLNMWGHMLYQTQSDDHHDRNKYVTFFICCSFLSVQYWGPKKGLFFLTCDIKRFKRKLPIYWIL
jgi:hypothetical protein